MQIKDLQIDIKHLGELVFWHEEILDLLRHESRPGTIPNTNEKLYKLIGFKPTFYSLHTVKINEYQMRVIALTKIQEDYNLIHRIISLIDKQEESNFKNKGIYKSIISNIVTNHIETEISSVLDDKDEFPLTFVSMRMYALRSNNLGSIL
ncbi:MAG: hypothetical protein F6K22_27515 [Okeania sp. SIO2F4]|uniref:hypothetical protein n=1 Tax=Okeania sp. SIO2F4 TaxID=2607790 RepID=UPI00142C821B|nr:hypothetical protein [Okeania sp. SIO2F4]NES06230.1 hypothetical protein [Okeania sp. SIO2F4]